MRSGFSANAYLIIIIYFGLALILKVKAKKSFACKFILSVLHLVMIMKISVAHSIGLSGLAVAIATFAYQATMQAEVRSPVAEAIVAPMSARAQATTAASGSFVGEAHPTSGDARIVEENGQRYLELDESFRSDMGPDLLVLLHEEAVPESYDGDSYLSLGQLQRAAGVQRYKIPADVNLQAFQSAVIWCREFDVTFGYATLFSN